jgi:uncharacterized membrane protein (UPF0182 family)
MRRGAHGWNPSSGRYVVVQSSEWKEELRVSMRPPLPSMLLSRRAKIALSTVAVIIVLLVLVVQLSGVYVNYLWFGEVGHRGVYSTVLWTRIILFFIFGALMALIIGGNLVVAYVLRPPFRPMSPEQQNLQNYALLLEPRRRLILIVVSLIALLSAGASAQSNWAMWQLWLHGGSFGQPDPLFGRDISFYAWDYPVYRTLLGFGFTAVIFALILSVVVHYLAGAIRLQTPGPKVTVAARRHITVLVFVFMALKAVAYWLDRYGFVFAHRTSFTGASYTDVHAALPAKTILFWIAVILALGVLASMWLRSALLPGIGFIVLLVLSILISGIYPAILQAASVKPNANTKEVPYIRRNLTATRQAYDIVLNSKQTPGNVTIKNYAVNSSPPRSAITETDPTIGNIRVLDPNVVSPTFSQQQAQQKNFYGFPGRLNIDRYNVNGLYNDYVVGVRELSAARLSGDQRNWINQYTNYTHGYGFVAAAADQDVTTSSQYAAGDIPQAGPLTAAYPLKQPRVYFGQLVSNYAIVGVKGQKREFDGSGNRKYRYDGSGGIKLNSFFTRLAFALHFKETNFLLNSTVSASGAKILINRDPVQRLEKVAPFLRVDNSPYPFIDSANGDITWMLDGYTTMDDYPYSQRQSLSSLTSDSLVNSNRVAGQPNSQINYIRNSVKATVDAYTGEVHLYAWDPTDPILAAWQKIFPGLVQPLSDMPAAVESHIRYPQDLFEVQRKMLEQYHVTNPVTFYNVGNKWTIPRDPSPDAVGDQPPYYVLAAPQDGSNAKSQFQLTSPMKVNQRSNLAAYITVDSDPGPDYGKMTVLQVSNGTVIDGPEQIANTWYSKAQIASDITLFDARGSTVRYGNLLTLPVGGSFLYVEPLYVQASSNGYPLLQRVIAFYGGKIGYGADLTSALTDLATDRPTGSSVSTNDTSSNGNGSPGPSQSPTSTSPGSSESSGSSTSPTPPPDTGSVSVAPGQLQLLQQIDNYFKKSKQAYARGDFVAGARAQGQAQKAIERYLTRYGALPTGARSSGSGTASPSTTPSRTPTTSSSPSGSR